MQRINNKSVIMDNQQNKFISVSYQLYTIEKDGKKNLEEQTQQGRPFQFISGFGVSLDGFEKQIVKLQNGEKFDFVLQPEEAFGEYSEEGVRKLDCKFFEVNDKFDSENIREGNVIALDDSDGKRFFARVLKVEADGVTLDINHPLAGCTLQFVGEVLENRDATNEEIQHLLNHLSGEGCGCGDCGDCGGGCGGHHEKEGGCEGHGGCGHCHH